MSYKCINEVKNKVSFFFNFFFIFRDNVFDVEYPEDEKLILYDEKDDVSTEYNDTIVEELSIDVNPVEKCSVGMTASY